MRRRLISVILFALIAATASSAVLYRIISTNRAPVAASAGKMIVSAHEMSTGTLIKDVDVTEIEWPSSAAVPFVRRREEVVGRVLLSPVGPSEPFAETRLAPKGSNAGLASRIPAGMRAVAVHVDEISGLSRFIFSGMHVDVISTGNAGSQSGAGTRTVLQNIEVLSTGDEAGRDAKERPLAGRSFNLLVSPAQAEILSQAVAHTRIDLVLRNPLDGGNFVSTLLPAPGVPGDTVPHPARKAPAAAPLTVPVKTPPIAAPLAPATTVEILHGAKKTITAVGDPDPAVGK